MIADEDVAADYIRTAMISSWAHDLRGFVWWCANEQAELTHTPYDWDSVERELGLFRLDGSPKPVADVFTAFSRSMKNFPLEKLPPRERVIICLRYGLGPYERTTQREIAEKLQISRSYVSRIEKKALERLRTELEQ